MKKVTPSQPGPLKRVVKYFPQVTRIRDETRRSATIYVTARDARNAKSKDMAQCALAKAACRQLKVDGAIIGLTVSYLIVGNTAHRYFTPTAVSREIVSFDRHKDFAPGSYYLSPVPPKTRLGTWKNKPMSTRTVTGKKPIQKIHKRTARVRSWL